MDKPSVFIGSSSEGLDFARAVRDNLDKDAETSLWDEEFFTLGFAYIESLVNALPRFDFAVLVLTPDDLVNSRNDESLGPRDNVIFELGLFMGGLGRSRTFIVHQAESELKMPSDLLGVSTATYRWPRIDNNHVAAVGPACNSIRRVIRDLGITESRAAKQLQEVRQKQDRLQDRIDQVQKHVNDIVAELFVATMSQAMFENLKKIASDHFGSFELGKPLERELYHLRAIGYVEIPSIQAIPKTGTNLSEYVKATEAGRQFVSLREQFVVRADSAKV